MPKMDRETEDRITELKKEVHLLAEVTEENSRKLWLRIAVLTVAVTAAFRNDPVVLNIIKFLLGC